MKQKICCLVLMLFPVFVSAQINNWQFIISGGGIASSMTGKGADNYSIYHSASALIVDYGTSAQAGKKIISNFSWSLGVLRKINNRLDIAADFSNTRLGGYARISKLLYFSEFRPPYVATFEGKGQDKFVLHYWGIPLKLHYYPLKNRRFYLTAGTAYDHLKGGKEFVTFTTNDPKATNLGNFDYTKNIKDNYLHFNWSALIGLGYKIKLNNVCSLATDLSYQRGLTNIAKDTTKMASKPIYTQFMNASLKVHFTL